MRVFLLLTQHGVRELRLIDGIREVLCLQAKCVAELVLLPSLAHLGAIEEVAGVKLDARLGGENLTRITRASNSPSSTTIGGFGCSH